MSDRPLYRAKTVADLILELQKLPQEAPVYFEGHYEPTLVRKINIHLKASEKANGAPYQIVMLT